MDPERFYNTGSIKRIFTPTRTFSGPGVREFVHELIPAFESYVIVVDHMQEHDELVSRLCASPHHLFGGPIVVSAEPTSASVDASLGRLGSRTPAAVVAIGGGSTLDTAKAITASLAYGHWHIKDPTPAAWMPLLIAVPTTAGSGSEVSRYYVITDASTKEKKSYRSWSIAPRYAIYDPCFLRNAPSSLLLLGAFDAFTHLWETFICRYERSSFTDMLALNGIASIVRSLDVVDRQGDRSDRVLGDLQYSAMLGGIALSNVRTGILHDAGEALAAQVRLSHPETLVPFFRTSLGLYASYIEDRVELLTEQLGISSLERLVAFWERLFRKEGIYEGIRTVVRSVEVDAAAIVSRIARDHVLVSKESPRPLTLPTISEFVEKALEHVGCHLVTRSGIEPIGSAGSGM